MCLIQSLPLPLQLRAPVECLLPHRGALEQLVDLCFIPQDRAQRCSLQGDTCMQGDMT